MSISQQNLNKSLHNFYTGNMRPKYWRKINGMDYVTLPRGERWSKRLARAKTLTNQAPAPGITGSSKYDSHAPLACTVFVPVL